MPEETIELEDVENLEEWQQKLKEGMRLLYCEKDGIAEPIIEGARLRCPHCKILRPEIKEIEGNKVTITRKAKKEDKGEKLKEPPQEGKIDLTKLETVDPNDILQNVLNGVKSATLTEDLKNYLLEIGENAMGGLSPRELYGELVAWGVSTAIALRVAKMYELKITKAQSKIGDDPGLGLKNQVGISVNNPQFMPLQARSDRAAPDIAGNRGNLSNAKPGTGIPIEVRGSPSPTADYTINERERAMKPVGYAIVDGQSIPAYSPNELLALKNYQMQVERHEKDMKRLDEEIKNIAIAGQGGQGEKPETEKVEVEIGEGQKIKVEPSTAFAFEKLKYREKEATKEADSEKETQIKRQNEVINTLKTQIEEQNKRQKELINYLNAIKEGKISFSGKTALDVVDTRLGDISQGVNTLVDKVKLPSGPIEPIKPPEKSEEERERIAREFEKKVDKSGELLEVESKILNE